MERKGVVPGLTVAAEGRQWGRGGTRVDGGTLPATVGWLTGRAAPAGSSSSPGLPELPSWL